MCRACIFEYGFKYFKLDIEHSELRKWDFFYLKSASGIELPLEFLEQNELEQQLEAIISSTHIHKYVLELGSRQFHKTGSGCDGQQQENSAYNVITVIGVVLPAILKVL